MTEGVADREVELLGRIVAELQCVQRRVGNVVIGPVGRNVQGAVGAGDRHRPHDRMAIHVGYALNVACVATAVAGVRNEIAKGDDLPRVRRCGIRQRRRERIDDRLIGCARNVDRDELGRIRRGVADGYIVGHRQRFAGTEEIKILVLNAEGPVDAARAGPVGVCEVRWRARTADPTRLQTGCCRRSTR